MATQRQKKGQPEGSVGKRHGRKALLSSARSLLKDGATKISWLRYVQEHQAAWISVVGEHELKHIWAVSHADLKRDDEEGDDENDDEENDDEEEP